MTTLLLAIACSDEPEYIVPEGLEALEDNLATLPADGSETIDIVSGQADDYAWVHGMGYVHAPIEEVWAAVQDSDVVMDRRAVTSWTRTDDTAPDYDVSFTMHHVVEDIVTVEYDLEWRQSLLLITPEEGEEIVACRYEKTGGSELIQLLVGSLLLHRVDDELTSMELVEHMAAPQDPEDRVARYVGDLHTDMVAFVHDEPLPEYTDED
jgi:hypothetical protein